jgi:hypothetical protein
MNKFIDPKGYMAFCEAMGWQVVEHSDKCADSNSPAGFNLLSPGGYKVRAFVTGVAMSAEDHGWFMGIVAGFCEQDGYDRAVMFHSAKSLVSISGKKGTMVGMLYSLKNDNWFPMFVNSAMDSIDAAFDVNTECMFRGSNSENEASFLIDDNSSVASLFDRLAHS